MRYVLFLIMLIVLPVVSGALIEGVVYDFSLQRVDVAVVEVNTEPVQRDVTVNGMYSFDVEPGVYNVTAQHIDAGIVLGSTTEEVIVVSDRSYTLDLILFPELEEPVDIVDDVDTVLDAEVTSAREDLLVLWGLPVALVVLLVFALVMLRNKKPEDEVDEVDEVIGFLKRVGGRATQKELRAQFPHSEAKMSLLISELEAKGKVSKIKRGRGNIVVLKK